MECVFLRTIFNVRKRGDNMKNEIELLYLETCLPDYHNGFCGHVYAIPVMHETTNNEVKQALLSEIEREEVWLNGDTLEEAAYTDIKQQVETLQAFTCTDPSDQWDKFIEPVTEEEDSFTVYAYFGVR